MIQSTVRKRRAAYETSSSAQPKSALIPRFGLELAAIAGVLRFSEEGMLHQQPVALIRFHIIEASPIMEKFPMSSKRNNYPPMLEYLFDLGRQTANAWMAQYGVALGQHSTVDLQQLLPLTVWGNV